MKELFISKLKNQEYISKQLFQNIQEKEIKLIPNNFNLDDYNDKILEQNYLKYKDYFKNMYKGIDDSIHLDKEQIKAILADEDYSLVIAGAGTGKTTTMVSKVKYLVDIKKIDPRKIVVMSYTKKSTEELEKRIQIDFNLPVTVTTFHSLGFMHIREIFHNRKCYVVDENLQNEIFLNYFIEKIFPNKERVKEIISLFDNNINVNGKWMFSRHFRENYSKYQTFEEYFKSYKKFKINEIKDLKQEIAEKIETDLNAEKIYTIKGELVKSKGEALIANFLFCNNIDYEYEKIYDELMNEHRIYRPDFTLTLGTQNIYIEYFGLSTYENNNLLRYEKIRRIKENYHQIHHTKFIKLDYEKGQDLLETLKNELLKIGFKLNPKSDIEIIETILDRNKVSQIFPFKEFLYNIINLIKSSRKRVEYQKIINTYLNTLPVAKQNQAKKQYEYINDFYLYYQKKLYNASDYGFDFSDMIYYANKYIETIDRNNNLNFEYLIIDEYQDISQERYELTKKIAFRNHAKVVAIGDDWQSIYAFSGSKIEYIYDFEKYFPSAKILKITKTYRNSQELIDYTGTFIMKNPEQIRKTLISDKRTNNPIRIVEFPDEIKLPDGTWTRHEYDTLKKLILSIHKKNPTHKILILARNNYMIEKCYLDPDLKDDIGTKIEYIGYKDLEIDGMSIHKSKGLTSDEVIVIGLNEKFPQGNYSTFWLESLFKNLPKEESIPYAEERRLFYVALTRTKNYVYLLINENRYKRSQFVTELESIINK